MSKASLVRDIRQYLLNGHNDIREALVVDVTTLCDYNGCPYCYMNCREGVGCSMRMGSARAIRAALMQLDISPETIWFSGGEPTVCPRLDKIAEVLALCCGRLAIATNGLMLGTLPDRAQVVLDNPLIGEVAVALHSANRRVHNLLMGCDEGAYLYDLAMSSVVNLGHAKRPLVKTISVNMNQECDLAAIVDEVERQGGKIDKVMLRIVDFGGDKATYMPSQGAMRELCRPTYDTTLEYFMQVRRLVREGRIDEGRLIDRLPHNLVHDIDVEYWSDIYRPIRMPAISVGGAFRVDAVRKYD